MEIWQVIAIFAGTIGTIGLISLIPGASNWITSIFTNLFNAMRQLVQFIMDHSPKPIKLVLFIGLFALVGGITYNWTVGAQYVCSPGDNTVIQVGYFEGLAYKLSPVSEESPIQQENERIDALLGLNSTKPVTPTKLNIVEGSNLIESEVVDWRSTTYNVYHALTPASEAAGSIGFASFMEASNGDIWQSWLGGLDYIMYDVCYDTRTETCLLERNSIKVSRNAIGTQLNRCTAPWGQQVGTIAYELNGDEELSADYSDGVRGTALLGWAFKSIEDCKELSSTEVTDLLELGGSFEDEYQTIFYSPYKQIVHANQDLLIGGVDDRSGYIYDVKYAAVFKEFVNGTVFTSSILTGPSSRDQSGVTDADTRECIAETDGNIRCDRSALILEGTRVVNGANSAVSYVCDENSADLFDTKPILIGIDILNWKVMAMFVLIGSMLSLYIWFKQF